MANFDSGMQRFESRRPNQPVSLLTHTELGRNRVALEMPRNGGVSFIRTWSPSPETDDGRGIPVSVSEADSLVSPF